MTATRLDRLCAVAAGGWLAASAALTVSRELTGSPDPGAFASTPSGIARGRVWTLLTSMLPVSRFPFAELAGCAVAVWAVVRLLGGRRFWVVALTSHIGSTLLVYAAIGVIWLVDRDAVSSVVVEDDYGISAVWLGSVGAIAVILARRGDRRLALALAAAAILASLALLPVTEELPVAEHLVALAVGAATAYALGQPPGRASPRSQAERRVAGSAGTWPSARMAANPVRARPSEPS